MKEPAAMLEPTVTSAVPMFFTTTCLLAVWPTATWPNCTGLGVAVSSAFPGAVGGMQAQVRATAVMNGIFRMGRSRPQVSP